MKGEHCLRHTIAVHPLKKAIDEHGNVTLVTNHYHHHNLKVLDFPMWICKKWSWYIDYCVAKAKVRFPRHYISHRVYGYRLNESDEETTKKRHISAAKAQISKVLNIMKEREAQISRELFNDLDSDPIIQACRLKLEEKRMKLERLMIS